MMDSGQNSIVDTNILDYIGLSKILNPYDPKIYNIIPIKVAAKIEIYIVNVTLIMASFSIYYSINDIYVTIPYLMVLVIFAGINFNYYYILKNSDAIWDILRVANIDLLYFKTPEKKTFKAERFKFKLATTISVIFIIFIGIAWIFLPILQHDQYFTINIDNKLYNYKFTPQNFILPISDEFYNKYYYVFHAYDAITGICVYHLSLMFDYIVITVCISIECHLKYIANSYSTLFTENQTTDKPQNIYDEKSRAMHDFKTMIRDNQRVIKIMCEFYKIFRPLILIEIFTESSTIVLTSFVLTTNYMNEISLTSVASLKMISALIGRVAHLFIICHFITNLKDQKGSMNFSLYCSNWTQTSINIKKLILLTMRMNDSEKSILKISTKRVINMEMFASVIQTSYTVTSVFAKTYARSQVQKHG